jgi:hypothetical protein
VASQHLSVRLERSTFVRPDDRSRQTGQTRSAVAKLLLEEGLRMDAHSGIVFRAGSTGRRPGLAGGPDVWEVVCVFQAVDPACADPMGEAATLLDLHPEQALLAR